MKRYLRPAITTALAAALLGAAPVSAQTLGSAQSFAVVGGTAVTVAGAGSVITGDVGVSPGTSMTGFPAGATVVPPFATHVNDGAAVAAQAAVTNLYSTLAGTGGAVAAAPELGGQTFTPGVHSFTTTANIAAGTTMRLSGAGIYIFKVGSAITANVGSSVVLEGGASACNVFWQVTSAATLNGVTFAGNVVAQSGVTLGVGAGLSGRALNTAAGPVTLAGGNTVGGCSTLPPVPPPVCPTISLSPATLPNGTVGIAYSQTILGSGGAAPYIFTLRSGALPTGTFLTATGVLAGTPTTAGTSTFLIRGTDANNCFAERAYTVVIAAAPVPPPACPTITLSPPTLPNGTVGIAYSQTILGSGGTAPYSFGISSGSMPAGLTLTATGVLSGTPTTAGSSTFTVRGTDANGCSAERTYTIVIAAAPVPPPGCPTITLSPPTLPNGTVGIAYSQTILGSGGTAPYSFGISSGSMPAGLTLTATGVLSGTPTTAGSSTFTVRGTDANGCSAERTYTIVIAAAPLPPPGCPPITLSPATLPNGIVGIAYSQTMLGGGGTAPYSFGITSGTLPAGLTLTPTGVLSGTPATAGSSTFTVRGTDANGCFAERIYTIAIAAAPVPPPGCPTITLPGVTAPNGIVGVAYSQMITASGGTAPYTFGLVAGALPAGLTLTPAGLFSGTPTVAGETAFTIRATDANGCFAERSYVLLIAAAPAPPPACPRIILLPETLGSTTVGVPINVQLRGTGGTGPYVFGVIGGALPDGIVLSPSGLISGTPTTTGTVTFTIRGTDANGCFDERTFSVDVLPVAPVPPPVCPPITLSPATLPNATVGVAISVTLTASGGAGPYVFAVVGGALPPGVTLSPAGVISGTPTATGTSTFTIRVTDANGCPVERTFTVSVITAVPTLPQTFMILLSLGLGAVGYLRLRRRTRVM